VLPNGRRALTVAAIGARGAELARGGDAGGWCSRAATIGNAGICRAPV